MAHYAQRFDARQRIAGGSLPSIETVQRALRAWGYDIDVSGVLDDATRATLRAFQLHFRPADFSGNLDADTCARLWALLERYLPEALATLAEPQPAAPPAEPQPAAPPAAPGR